MCWFILSSMSFESLASWLCCLQVTRSRQHTLVRHRLSCQHIHYQHLENMLGQGLETNKLPSIQRLKACASNQPTYFFEGPTLANFRNLNSSLLVQLTIRFFTSNVLLPHFDGPKLTLWVAVVVQQLGLSTNWRHYFEFRPLGLTGCLFSTGDAPRLTNAIWISQVKIS